MVGKFELANHKSRFSQHIRVEADGGKVTASKDGSLRISDAAYVPNQSDPQSPSNFVPLSLPKTFATAPYILHLLPALSSAWPNGNVSGLRARGGLEVDIQRLEGKLSAATIRATKTASFRVYAHDELSEKFRWTKVNTKYLLGK